MVGVRETMVGISATIVREKYYYGGSKYCYGRCERYHGGGQTPIFRVSNNIVGRVKCHYCGSKSQYGGSTHIYGAAKLHYDKR